MTLADLIHSLSKLPPDSRIVCYDRVTGTFNDIGGIDEIGLFVTRINGKVAIGGTCPDDGPPYDVERIPFDFPSNEEPNGGKIQPKK